MINKGKINLDWNYCSFLIAFCTGLYAVNAQADVTPVYQINETSGTYLQTALTHDIYRYSESPSLQNLVVLDKQGNKLPYRITALPVGTTEKSIITPVRFFSVEEGMPPEKLLAISKASILIEDKTITLSVDGDLDDKLADRKVPIDFYLVDITKIDMPINTLLLEWQGAEANQYLEVEVSGSKDLQNWRSLSSHTLAKLQKEEQILLRNSIPLNIQSEQYAYIRLEFLRGGDNLQLTQVSTETHQTLLNPIPEDKWEVTGELAADQDSALNAASYSKATPVAAWEFQRKESTPVNKVSLNLGSNHYGDSIKIYSRHTQKQPWQLLNQGIWFNAQIGDDWQHSEPIAIYANTDSFWRIELNELARTTHNPMLVFERAPQILQFIANNAAPYSIAVDDKSTSQHTSTQIFSQLTSGKSLEWKTVNFIALEPKPDSFSKQAKQINWKTIMFWSVLLIAVGILIGVAIRLFRQMRLTEIK